MRILITNDDGIRAEGIRHLVEVARQFGQVKVVAPNSERSCCSHAMTMREPLRVTPYEWDGCEAYEVNGYPVDCVNIGLEVAYPDGCDLVLSGINLGPNLGFDITYSGTAAGAMEGTINSIRSIALSMALFVSGAPLYYETGSQWFAENWEMLVNAPQAPLTFLNVNIPAMPHDELRGYRLATMGRRVYQESIERREDPWGNTYFWQGSAVVMHPEQPGTDVEAINEGYVSITPITLDWTNHAHVRTLATAFEEAKKPIR